MSEMFFGGHVPEEVQAEVKRRVEHAQMHAEVNAHVIRDLFDSLDKDQLKQFDFVISLFGGSEAGATYIRGRIEAILQYKFEVCPCGSEHDPNELLGEVHPPHMPEEKDGRPIEDTDLPEATEPAPDIDRYDAGFEIGSDEWRQAVGEWDLSVIEPVNNARGYVLKCKCGMDYVSLADRMLRPKGIDGCGGCQIRSAHG